MLIDDFVCSLFQIPRFKLQNSSFLAIIFSKQLNKTLQI